MTSHARRLEGSADDGKRCSSAGRLDAEKNIYLRVRGSGRGDTIIGPDRRGVADDGKRCSSAERLEAEKNIY